jgi:hypothetical protein
MRWYIAGKITGNDAYREQFAAAAAKLRHIGHDCINPAENPEQPTWEAYMALGISQLVTCDGIALLPNWKDSNGATKEATVAEWLKMPRLYL